MRLIIAGGRDYEMTEADFAFLCSIPEVSEVVSGGATGADYWGEVWARVEGIPIRRFPADWLKHGRAAGPIRNAEMAEYADALALFPGGKGSESMRREAERVGIPIFSP